MNQPVPQPAPHRTFRHVRHSDVPAYEARGWRIVEAPLVSHHNVYSLLMESPAGEHPEPRGRR